MKITYKRCIMPMLFALALWGCRKDDPIIPEEIVSLPPQAGSTITGFYLLNEGNMNMNKASLDYYDYTSGTYRRNVYGQANPQATLGLGDVGNDLGVYGSKLYAVINCSNKVEVMDVTTTQRLKVIDVKNCRYLAFAKGKAYVSAYDGEVALGEVSPNGFIAEIDTATLVITRKVEAGRQPEGIAVVGNKLYVANSGGYSPPNYETTITVIDLDTFTKIKEIDVAPNLHRLKVDRYNNLYVSSRGDNLSIPSKLFVIDTQIDAVKNTFDISCDNLTIAGDTVYVIGSERYSMINVQTGTLLEGSFLPESVSHAITKPYCVAVDPESKYIYITDAGDFVSPGKLYCIDRQGQTVFTVTTGDIPAHIAFIHPSTNIPETDIDIEAYTNGITRVFEYFPAPGQFINTIPAATEEDTPETMRQKAEESLTNGSMISLGGFGGYVVFGFDHTVVNREGNDFIVLGNAFANSVEPGVIMVSVDANGNGLPDDEWYEIAGSEYHKPGTVFNYEITYYKPDSEPDNQNEPNYIRWTDNQGASGYLSKNGSHTQSYYPLWTKECYTLSGTFMETNMQDVSGNGTHWLNVPYEWGYADNWPNNDSRAQIDIDWAVDQNGLPVKLKGIDFVKVYTGNRSEAGWLGEISTEVCGFIDLHL